MQVSLTDDATVQNNSNYMHDITTVQNNSNYMHDIMTPNIDLLTTKVATLRVKTTRSAICLPNSTTLYYDLIVGQ